MLWLAVKAAMRSFGLLVLFALAWSLAGTAVAGPDCSRPFSLALHDHGLLFDSQTGEGIDKDMADELTRRSGCKITLSLMPRARIWQLIESGALDFSLSGISSGSRERFAAFAWYFSNKYYLLVRAGLGVQKPADFEANPALKLGVMRGFRYSANANGLVDRLNALGRISFASQLAPLYQVLLDDHVQAMIIEPFDYPALGNEHIRLHTQTVAFDDPPVLHGLIMSRKSLTAPQQEAWRELIGGMRADGTVQRIFERYFSPDLARAMTHF